MENKMRRRDFLGTAALVNANTIEGFWSIFERGIVGSFHKVSAKVYAALRCGISVPPQPPLEADIFWKDG